MKKIILEFLSAILIFVLTLFVTDQYIVHKSVDASDFHCNHMLDEYSDDIDDNLTLTQNAVLSFLSGNFDIRYDSVNTLSHSQFYVRDADIYGLTHLMETDIRDFLSVNPSIYCAGFIFDEHLAERYPKAGFTANEGRGTAVLITSKSNQRQQISDYDYMHAKSYSQLKRTHRFLWTMPSSQSTVRGKVILFYVPIFCEDGSLFGAFVINLSLAEVEADLVSHLPYGKENSEIVIYDDDGRIILSYPHSYEHMLSLKKLFKLSQKILDEEFTKEQGRYINFYHGTKYYYYTRDIPLPHWHILTCFPSKAIYQSAAHVRLVTLCTSLAGFVLMLLCVYFIFRQMRRNLRQKTIAEEELRMAANVQTSILRPATLQTPSAILSAFMRPAKEAGGDLYDYVVKDDKLIFCVGDVSGKGMSAALFMTQVVSLFRSAVRESADPAVIVTHINNVLSDNNPDMTFCTFFVGVLQDKHLTFCNAGHNPIVVKSTQMPSPNPYAQILKSAHTDSRQVKNSFFLKERSNLAIGLMGGFPFQDESVELHSHDMLVIYSDGVTEAKNSQREMFEESRLLVSVEATPVTADAAAVTQTLLHDIDSFVGDARQSDDITIMTLCLTK